MISGRKMLSIWYSSGLVFFISILVNCIIIVIIRMKLMVCRYFRFSGCSM